MIIQANCTSGEIVEREMNAAELTQSTKDKSLMQAQAAAQAEAKAAKAALLDRLGITAEEAKLLLS